MPTLSFDYKDHELVELYEKLRSDICFSDELPVRIIIISCKKFINSGYNTLWMIRFRLIYITPSR